jgi:4-hydroxy-3-methylbut-2-enyl diphosphate reductase
MEIIVGKFAGFCNGAKNAVIKTNEALNKDKLYSIGELIHNEEVVNYLKERGLIVKNNIDEIPDNANIIIRAHGEGIKFYQEAKRKNLNITDLTCGRVKLVHNKILNNKNSFIIIIGKKNHPEVIAHKTYSDNSYVVENQSDINEAYDNYLKSGKNRVYVVSQTTFNSELFNELINEIKHVFKNTVIDVDNTICDATNIRQKEAREIASKVDKMIVIGGKNSSNTKELATEASKCCSFVYLIQNKNDLKEIEFSKDDVVGITAGASTPDSSINDVVEYLNNVYNIVK